MTKRELVKHIRSIFLNRHSDVDLVTAAALLGVLVVELERDVADGVIVATTNALGVRISREEMMAAAMRVWEPEVIEEALGAGAAAVLPKPVRLVSLCVRVRWYQREVLAAVAREEGTTVDEIVRRQLDDMASAQAEDVATAVPLLEAALVWPSVAAPRAERVGATSRRRRRREPPRRVTVALLRDGASATRGPSPKLTAARTPSRWQNVRTMKTLRFETPIHASREKVWRTMLEPDTYRIWTAEFIAGSYYEGSWDEGARIRFLSPDGGGVTAVIDANRPFEHISIRHLGEIRDGVDDTESDAVKSWAGEAFERYTLREENGITHLEVTCDVTPEYEGMMNDMWPRALQRLKSLVETGS